MLKHTNVIDITLLLCRSIQMSFHDWWGNSGEMVIHAFALMALDDGFLILALS